MEFSLGLNQPLGRFKSNVDKEVFNPSTAYLRQLKVEKPLFYGLGLDWGFIDSYMSEVERQTSNGGAEIWDGNSSSYFVSASPMVRYFLDIGSARTFPYFSGHLGLDWFITTTTFTFPDSEESTSNFDNSDWSMKYGAGMGIATEIHPEWFVNIQVQYTTSISTKYHVNTDKSLVLPLSSTIEALDLKKSPTTRILYSLGISKRF